jgi:hypothetical protein
MTGKRKNTTNEQSAKNKRVSIGVRKELLSLHHRFGEKTSCKGHLKASFLLVNSGKILSKDGAADVHSLYHRAWTAFFRFSIRFTRADQWNERSWDTLFHYALIEATTN